MRKIPLPDENRRRAERLSGGDEDKALRKSRKVEKSDFYEDETEGIDEAVKKSAKKSAKEYALLLVSTHTYTEKALFQKMFSKKIYSDTDIEEAVEYVKGFGYINDKRLAENMLPKLAEKCFGRSKICRYLASKGISEDVIDSLDFSEIDFVYYCKRLLCRHSGKTDDKIMRSLLNAGYTYDEIRAAKKITDI